MALRRQRTDKKKKKRKKGSSEKKGFREENTADTTRCLRGVGAGGFELWAGTEGAHGCGEEFARESKKDAGFKQVYEVLHSFVNTKAPIKKGAHLRAQNAMEC